MRKEEKEKTRSCASPAASTATSTSMRVQEVWLPGRWPSLNELMYKGTRHKIQVKRLWADLTIAFVNRAKLAPVSKRVHLSYEHRRANLRGDPSNFAAGAAKVIEDSLVKCGILKNDGFANVSGFTHTFKIDAENPGVKVVISEEEILP